MPTGITYGTDNPGFGKRCPQQIREDSGGELSDSKELRGFRGPRDKAPPGTLAPGGVKLDGRSGARDGPSDQFTRRMRVELSILPSRMMCAQ